MHQVKLQDLKLVLHTNLSNFDPLQIEKRNFVIVSLVGHLARNYRKQGLEKGKLYCYLMSNIAICYIMAVDNIIHLSKIYFIFRGSTTCCQRRKR